jgi:multiple sugar transport system substrate-binding protein
MNVYAGKGTGEASTMQGFEMLLYGTPGGTLYDADSKKWITGSKGFTDSLNFLKTIYSEGLAATPQQALDPNWGNTVGQELIPQGKVAIDLDGSWVSNNWQDGGATPWPQWKDTMGTAKMPTQDGSAPGAVSLSGGWTWAISAKSKSPDAAWSFIQTAQSEPNAVKFDIANTQIAVRKDVAADPSYQKANAKTPVFSEVVKVTKYRPAYAEYPRISNEIQVAMESVMAGQASPQDAARQYDDAVKGIVGDGGTVRMP